MDERKTIRQMELYMKQLEDQINAKNEQGEALYQFFEKASQETQNMINDARRFCYRIIESEIAAENLKTNEIASLPFSQLLEKAVSVYITEQKQTRKIFEKFVERMEEKNITIYAQRAQISQLQTRLNSGSSEISEKKLAEKTGLAVKSEFKSEIVNTDVLRQELTPEMYRILEAIGNEGLSEQTDIINYCQKYIPNCEAAIYRTIPDMSKNHIVSKTKIGTGIRWFYTIGFTDSGRALFVDRYKKEPVETEAQKLIREHDNARHGYMIKDAARILSETYGYNPVFTSRKKNYIRLSNRKACIPDIIAVKSQNTDYFEVECGNQIQSEFNEKCNKLTMITKRIHFIVPDASVMTRKLMPKIEKWIKESGGITPLAQNGITVYLTTMTKFANEKWEVIYNMTADSPITSSKTN